MEKETTVPRSKMEAASWAATQHFALVDVDGFDRFGCDFLESEQIKQNLVTSAKIDVNLIQLQTIVAFVGLERNTFYLGVCVRLQPNTRTDHVQIHHYCVLFLNVSQILQSCLDLFVHKNFFFAYLSCDHTL